MDSPGAPARLGRYELLARLASGGMGEIFLARLEGAAGFEKLFVIKRVLPHLAGDPRFRAMLIGEARIASMMTHANVCQVYELGETDGQLYIVMEYLEGTTVLPLLRRLSKQGAALDFGFIGGVIQQATDGLHYAHELKDRSGDYLGIVHRDVTPSNVFLTDAGVVKVLDFGIAKVKNASAQTQTGTVKGKYAYMAPEQLRGAAVDRRADIFALGVVVYEMLALRRLFQRKTDYLTFRAVMEQPIMDIRHYRPDCPDVLANALARALDRDPAGRFDTARQFGSAVLDAIGAFRRPWTQGEISDFVTTHFADDIGRRSTAIAAAVHATPRRTMPQILQAEEDTIELEDSGPEFPPVDSVSETPVDVRHLRGPSDEHTAVNDPTVPPPQLQALRAVPGPPPLAQQQPIVVVNPRRSVIWPLIAFAMVAVSGGALYLVWNRPTSVVITGAAETGSASNTIIVGRKPAADDRAAEPDRGEAPARPGTDGSDQPAPDAVTPSVAPPVRPTLPAARPGEDRPPSIPFNAAVHKQRAAVNRCVKEHGEPPPGTTVTIEIAPSGRVKSVELVPEKVDRSPFGDCIKGVFMTTPFPRGDGDFRLTVNLKVQARAAGVRTRAPR